MRPRRRGLGPAAARRDVRRAARSDERLPAEIQRFFKINFRKFTFSGSDLIGCTFGESELVEYDFRDCRLDRTEFFHCDLRRSDFRSAVGYQIDAAANKLKDAAFSLPEAFRLLHGLGIRPDG
ncbi:MAG TPA: pentapeptide repeat-containing protein [Firmicutes bacterium]|nr:pentapeptide repeat-containing protein [Bacillota bacterium]